MIKPKYHHLIYISTLCAIAVGLLFGKAILSIPMILLSINWIFEGNFKYKLQQIISSKLLICYAIIFLIHLLGMLYTSDTSYGWHDLQIKLPILIIPLIIYSSTKISKNETKLILYFHLFSVLICTLYCFAVYKGYAKHPFLDLRETSVFISHIRFALNIALSIMALCYFIFEYRNKFLQALFGVIIIWFLYYMQKIELATGIVCLCIVLMVFILKKTLSIQKMSVLSSFLILFIVILIYGFLKLQSGLKMYEPSQDPNDNIQLKNTVNGNNYQNDAMYSICENGHYAEYNVCEKELREAWELRSKIAYDHIDHFQNIFKYTIYRYMASKNLTKDSVGVSKLSNQDIKNIELGYTNFKHLYTRGINHKWREVMFEFHNYTQNCNPSGHSLLMRLEFWKTAIQIIKKHPWFGVGTGDVKSAFKRMYIETKSRLDIRWRLRSHNQFLTITVAFGITGFILFSALFLMPLFIKSNSKHSLFLFFFIIVCISFLTEDTLESQAGVGYVMFFTTIFTHQKNKLDE